MDFIKKYLEESKQIIDALCLEDVESLINVLVDVKKNDGRLFILGVGGGAGHASHAVNDFRKICGIESYAPSDNVSELTARVNDEGWDTCYKKWLEISKLNSKDAVLIFSVGGGDAEKGISVNLVESIKYGKEKGATICGIVSDLGGYTAKVGDAVVQIPAKFSESLTAHTEAFQAVVWHLIVAHPKLQKNKMKWESTRIPTEK